MLKLEDIKKDAHIGGLQGDEVVRIVQIEPVVNDTLTVIYKDSQGKLGEQILFRSHEDDLERVQVGRPWAFDAPGAEFKLGLEAYRITQAAFFDPMMAVHTSNVEPLPHQISAVYDSMLPRQPLRFVLADDPGAGKTIMAGLLIRELLMRADIQRVLIVSPGGLTEQWQDELREKFGVEFKIFSREKQEESASGNLFNESDQLLCRLDQLARNEELQKKLKESTGWDMVIVDEAHKLSANYYGNKVNKTKRFLLGELLGSITRHFLLMTATPHNGKEEDFQLWLSLLDSDRFYGRLRADTRKVDVSDMMHRMVKEDLLKFDGTPLFPERRAYTAKYELSELEESLYERVTTYVREEMDRADKLDGKKKSTVGFALTQLQRRLASSPAAIYQSLKRRRERLEARLELESQGQAVQKQLDLPGNPDDLDDLIDELSADEYEHYVEQAVDQETSAKSIPELEAEIHSLGRLEEQAHKVRQSGKDRKWEQLSEILQEQSEMLTTSGKCRKLIIFTEHKDTLHYLVERVGNVLGKSNAICTIHGGINRDKRIQVQEEFRNDPEVIVLIATDAAGEGINLQNANLMVNYDLPWNPNRLEQRFGRIHRIGQTEVCHLWNMVANKTREGAVFQRLFEKIEAEKKALGDRVFDVLGEAFDGVSLKDLLIDAIRYNEDPKVKARMFQKIDSTLDTERLKDILERKALDKQHMGLPDLYAVKEEMEKAEARKLQPYFIRAFFSEAFKTLGGKLLSRESGCFKISHVPAIIREHDRTISKTRTHIVERYERICFERQNAGQQSKSMEFIHPSHPLMRASTDLILQQHRSKLKQGAVLVDPSDDSIEPKVLFMVEHTVRETGSDGKVASRRLQFVEINEQGNATNAGWAPHLDLQPIDEHDSKLVEDILHEPWLNNELETRALKHASQQLVPDHYTEVKERREHQTDKILSAVRKRLVVEISYLDGQAIKLQDDVDAGKKPRLQLDNLKRRSEELSVRLNKREEKLRAEKKVVSSAPVVLGGALVIPRGLLAQRKGETQFSTDADARTRIEHIAMNAVMDVERGFGNEVTDVSVEKCGWDITSRPPPNQDDSIKPDRHIEVKGRAKGQSTITISRNEIIYSLNQADKFILAIVIVDGESYDGPHYVSNPFQELKEGPGFGVTSINYNLSELLSKATPPK